MPSHSSWLQRSLESLVPGCILVMPLFDWLFFWLLFVAQVGMLPLMKKTNHQVQQILSADVNWTQKKAWRVLKIVSSTENTWGEYGVYKLAISLWHLNLKFESTGCVSFSLINLHISMKCSVDAYNIESRGLTLAFAFLNTLQKQVEWNWSLFGFADRQLVFLTTWWMGLTAVYNKCFLLFQRQNTACWRGRQVDLLQGDQNLVLFIGQLKGCT